MFLSVNRAKYRSTQIAVVIAVLLVVWQLFVSPFSPVFQISFFVISIFAFGIQHGALDHMVEAEIAWRKHTSFHITTFLGRYTVLMGMYALLWYFFPQVSFLFFILMSGWHFGETDITGHNNSKPWMAAKLLYGVAIIGWILFWHTAEADNIISKIISPQTATYQLWLVLVRHCTLMLILFGILIAGLLFTHEITHSNSLQKTGLFINLVLIIACGAGLPLLLSFALYFAGWHSVITLHNINTFTQKETTVSQPLPVKKLWLQALPLSVTAIAGLVLTGFLLQRYAPLFQPLPLVFIFLSLITLPHMSIMHQLSKRLFP